MHSLSGESNKTSQLRIQHWLAISWANVNPDLGRHMSSLDHDELNVASLNRAPLANDVS